MQIPSSLASIVSYWLPSLGDTEKKAQGGKTPDRCSLSLDQVGQIYKSIEANGRDSSPQFIRELEQTSWQQKQMTSGIFNHLNSITANINRISGRVQSEPNVLQIALPACAFFLFFAMSTSIFVLRKSKNLENELAALRKNQADERESSTLLINDLARTVREIQNKVSFQATQIHELTLKIKDFQNELTAVKIEIAGKLQEEKSITAEQIENIESSLQVLMKPVKKLAAHEDLSGSVLRHIENLMAPGRDRSCWSDWSSEDSSEESLNESPPSQ